MERFVDAASKDPAGEVPADLVRRAQQGDRTAMQDVLTGYRGAMWATALAVTRRRDVAEDVLQEASLQAWRGIGGLRDAARAGAWLCTLARRAGWRLMASVVRREREEAAAVDRPSAERSGDRGGHAERVWEALARLGAREREVFLMRHLEECSYEEIGRRVGVSPRGVETSLYRTRRRLQEAISR